jgi:hypothetical protein
VLENRTKITRVNIGPGVKNLIQGCFHGSTSIKEFTVNSSNTVYGAQSGVLYKLDSNKSRTIIHTYPAGKAKVSGIITDIPTNVTEIMNYAFGSSGITSVTIPENVVTIGSAAFFGDTITSVTLGAKNLATTGPVFGTDVSSVIFGENVESIAVRLFEDCEDLTSVTFPNKLVSIWDGAFGASGGGTAPQITRVVIPASVGGIGEDAFGDTVIRVKFEGANTLIGDGTAYDSFVAATGSGETLFDAYRAGGIGEYLWANTGTDEEWVLQ